MTVLSKLLDEQVVDLTWCSLQQPVYQNGLFKSYFFDLEVLIDTASDANLSYCPGLAEALSSDELPGLCFFESLPTDIDQRWALYVIILKRFNGMTLIYIGSATGTKGGVAQRFIIYDNPVYYSRPELKKSAVPKHMDAAIKEGYTITHKGLLAWCPRPAAVDVARIRLLFVAMEAAFSFHFWAMKSRDKDYGIGDCCPWSRDQFTYHGLCSHNSLLEAVRGDFDLTPEQVEILAALAKEKRRLHNAIQYKRQRELDIEGYLARHRKKSATYRKNSADKKSVNEKRFRAKAKEEQRNYCHTCGVACNSQFELDRHNRSRRHKLAVKRAANGRLRFHCRICDSSFTHRCHLDRHKQGKRHQEKVAAATSGASLN